MTDELVELVKVNNNEYRLMELLGKGKGGYSYLRSGLYVI